jgi:hypothetical protein
MMLTGEHTMSGHVKMGLLIGGAILIATGVWIYFSPYQTCVRATVAFYDQMKRNYDPSTARMMAEMSCSTPSR